MGGLINSASLGAGLAGAGQALSDAAIMAMKSEEEGNLMDLANTLATQRESTLESQRETFQGSQTAKQQEFQTSERVAGQQFQTEQQQRGFTHEEAMPGITAAAQVGAHGQELQQDTDAAIDKLQKLSQPDKLAAQRAVAMATQLPNWNIQFKDDGSTVRVNPLTGQVVPLTDTNGAPIKFQNPAVMQAITEQFRTLQTRFSQLSAARQSDMRAAEATVIPDQRQTAIDAVKKQYDPELKVLDNQLTGLGNALTGRTGFQSQPTARNSNSVAQPKIPPSLTGKPGLQWSASRQQFRDSDVNTYDADGNPTSGKSASMQ
jgi:hypothetical protein